MEYTVYIVSGETSRPWTKETSYADAVHEVEYLRKYENVDAIIIEG